MYLSRKYVHLNEREELTGGGKLRALNDQLISNSRWPFLLQQPMESSPANKAKNSQHVNENGRPPCDFCASAVSTVGGHLPKNHPKRSSGGLNRRLFDLRRSSFFRLFFFLSCADLLEL